MLQTNNGNYFGIIVGRCANRIANATFTIDGKRHRVTANDGPHSLHGGQRGWGMQVFAQKPECTANADDLLRFAVSTMSTYARRNRKNCTTAAMRAPSCATSDISRRVMQVWDAEKTTHEGSPAVRLTYRSKNGEEVGIILQHCHTGGIQHCQR
jgi:hypothetical protein